VASRSVDTQATVPAPHLLEEALELLRLLPADGWMQYLLGAVPFLLAVVAFLRDMSSGYAAGRCLTESLVCALALCWNGLWKARFAGTLGRTLASDEAIARSSFGQCLYIQLVFQSLKLLVLPLALVSILPLAWTCAFFRTANREADDAPCTLVGVARISAKHASVSLRSTWGALLLFVAMGAVVFVNVFVLLLFLPELMKIFTGYENEWTRNAGRILNFNLFTIAVAITWFLIDPLIQSYFVVRCFYNEARTTGRDLLIRLRRVAAAMLLGIAIGSAAAPARASLPPAPSQSLSSGELDRAVTRALRRDEFEWQRTRQAPDTGNPFVDRISRDLDKAIHQVRSWISAVRNAIRKMMASPKAAADHSPDRRAGLRLAWWMCAIAAAIVLAMLFVLFRGRVGLPSTPEAGASPDRPDIMNDQTVATDLPDDEWLRLAREYLSNGEFRLAIRSMYLANVAYLGSRQLIAVQKSKSNGIYERELRVRTRASALTAAFAAANRSYERVWYGLHDVTPDLIAGFEHNVEIIRHAEA
jgi:hypothetical protein